MMARRIIRAKYAGRCVSCGGGVAPGDSISWAKGRAIVHESCEASSEAHAKQLEAERPYYPTIDFEAERPDLVPELSKARSTAPLELDEREAQLWHMQQERFEADLGPFDPYDTSDW